MRHIFGIGLASGLAFASAFGRRFHSKIRPELKCSPNVWKIVGARKRSGWLHVVLWPMNGMHPVFHEAATAALARYDEVRAQFSRLDLEEVVAEGADGTPTMRVDALVEEAIVDVAIRHGVNVLSEEIGFIDRRSSYTLVVDPLDGSANAAAGVPLACFSAALVDDDTFVQAYTSWLATGQTWAGSSDGMIQMPKGWTTTGRTGVAGGAISLLRPHPKNRDSWWNVTERAARIRILSCSTLESMLVLQGSTDAFLDAGSDTHRLMDIAAALVLLPAAGGAVIDAFGRPITFDLDLHRRWSGIVAATPQLAEELAELVRAGAYADSSSLAEVFPPVEEFLRAESTTGAN